jgi:hypothetical protein
MFVSQNEIPHCANLCSQLHTLIGVPEWSNEDACFNRSTSGYETGALLSELLARILPSILTDLRKYLLTFSCIAIWLSSQTSWRAGPGCRISPSSHDIAARS